MIVSIQIIWLEFFIYLLIIYICYNVFSYRENVTLWNELVELRQKHQRQQQIVNKVTAAWKIGVIQD